MYINEYSFLTDKFIRYQRRLYQHFQSQIILMQTETFHWIRLNYIQSLWQEIMRRQQSKEILMQIKEIVVVKIT